MKRPGQDDLDRLVNQTTRSFSREHSQRQQELAATMSSAGPEPFEEAGLMLGNIRDLAPEEEARSEKSDTEDQKSGEACKEEDDQQNKRKWW